MPPPDTASPTTAPAPGTRYAWYVVGVLLLLNVSSFIDRQVMALLLTPIKADLGLTDKVYILCGVGPLASANWGGMVS